jgi:hypothetical protein
LRGIRYLRGVGATAFVIVCARPAVRDVVAIDVRDLAFGSGIPAGIDAMIRIEPDQRQGLSHAPITRRCEGRKRQGDPVG